MGDGGGRRPNVLFIMADQHNAACLSCAGHADVRTPNLDRLAAQGVRLTRAYTNNPIRTPSRMSYLSGQYPSAHGYYALYGPEPVQPLTSLFRHFAQAGYRTGAAGKLHTPRYWIERDCQFVYDEFVEFPKYLEAVGLYEQNDNRAFVRAPDADDRTSSLPLEHSCERALARQAIRFFRNEGEPRDRGAAGQPWLLWLSFSRPHQPTTPSEPFASMYDPAHITLPERGDFSCADEAALRRRVARYYGLVSQVDESVGLVLREVEARGELDNTIVLYTADHGEYAGHYGRFEKKGGISHSAICRVPALWRFPARLPSNRVIEHFAEAVDVFPTLCDLAGVAPPNTVQGRSMLPLFDDPPQPIRDSALTENAWRKALQTARYRYVANLPGEDERDELYDCARDPGELVNQIENPAYAAVRQELQRRLLDRVVHAAHPITLMGGGWHDHRQDLDGRANLTSARRVTPYD